MEVTPSVALCLLLALYSRTIPGRALVEPNALSEIKPGLAACNSCFQYMHNFLKDQKYMTGVKANTMHAVDPVQSLAPHVSYPSSIPGSALLILSTEPEVNHGHY